MEIKRNVNKNIVCAAYSRMFEMYRTYKLIESTKTSAPAHFNLLLENLLLERNKLKEENSEMSNCFKIEQDLMYCVALTVALEVGFRLRITGNSSTGFDIRAMKELTSLDNFRNFPDSCLKTVLYLPSIPSWQFRIISTPTCYDCALYNMLALEDGHIRSASSNVIPCSKYIRTSNKGLEMFEDINTLSEIFANAFIRIRNDALEMTGFDNFNLLSLPDELKRIIFLKLKAKDFVNLCETGKVMWNFIRDEIIWRYFLTRDFSIVINEGSSYSTYRAMAQQGLASAHPVPRYSDDIVHSDISLEFIEHGQYL